MLIRVTAPHYCAGLVIKDDVCIHSAPILKWCRGKNLQELILYFTKKEYEIEMLNANDVPGKGGDFKREVLEADVYPGRVVRIIDYGLQNQRPFKGEDKPPAREIGLTYEFSEEFMKDKEGNELKDKPRWLREILPLHNLKAEKAKSTQRYKALDPEGVNNGDFSQLLGAPCNITVIVEDGQGKNKGKKYEKVASIAPMSAKKAEKLPPLVNEPIFFDLDKSDLATFKSLPKWDQEKIKANLEFNGSPLQILLGEQVVEQQPEPEQNNEPEEEERPY